MIFLKFRTEEEVALDSDDDYTYEEVPVEDDLVPPGKSNFLFYCLSDDNKLSF